MDHSHIAARRIAGRGWGVFATGPIKKGERIASFDGRRYGWSSRWTAYAFHHAIQYGPRAWRMSKGVACLLNHSCEPNAGIRGLFDIVAMRNIRPGEELTWDYEMTERPDPRTNPDHWRMRCHCGARRCRKFIWSYDNLSLALRRRYRGYISEWLSLDELGPRVKKRSTVK